MTAPPLPGSACAPGAAFGLAGDLILVVYLFVLSRFFFSLSGLASGSTFGGMGARRDLIITWNTGRQGEAAPALPLTALMGWLEQIKGQDAP